MKIKDLIPPNFFLSSKELARRMVPCVILMISG